MAALSCGRWPEISERKWRAQASKGTDPPVTIQQGKGTVSTTCSKELGPSLRSELPPGRSVSLIRSVSLLAAQADCRRRSSVSYTAWTRGQASSVCRKADSVTWQAAHLLARAYSAESRLAGQLGITLWGSFVPAPGRLGTLGRRSRPSTSSALETEGDSSKRTEEGVEVRRDAAKRRSAQRGGEGAGASGGRLGGGAGAAEGVWVGAGDGGGALTSGGAAAITPGI
jgi:hypothetical protein